MTYAELTATVPTIPACHTTAVIARRGDSWLLLGVGRDADEAEAAAAGKKLITPENGWERFTTQIQRGH